MKDLKSGLTELVSSLNEQRNSKGSFIAANPAKNMLSLEAAKQDIGDVVTSNASNFVEDLRSTMGVLGVSLEDAVISEASFHAAALVAAAVSDQKTAGEYNRAALTVSPIAGSVSLEGLNSGVGGDLDLVGDNTYTQEAYEDSQIANYGAQSIVLNALASRQDPFAEAFFPTKVISPNEGGLSVTLAHQDVIDYRIHANTGRLLDLNKRPLLEAYADASVLARRGTELVPNSTVSPELFAPASEIADQVIDMGDVQLTTRPLVVNKRINLLGLSQHPGLLDAGLVDITDQIAAGIRLDKMYIRLEDTSGQDPVVENLVVALEQFSRAQFRQAQEGTARDVVLSFPAERLYIDKNTKTTAGASSALLDAAVGSKDYVVNISVNLHGTGNLNTGGFEINPSPITVTAVYNAGGTSISLTAGEGKAVVDRFAALKANIAYVTYKGRRSNSNWRTTGSLIDVNPMTEKYAVEMGNPISVLSPVNTDDQNAVGAKLAGMINAVRVRTSNNAVTTLLNYIDHLEAQASAIAIGLKTDLIGIGRHLVKPYFAQTEVDVKEQVVNIKTKDRADDTAEVIVNVIRDQVYKMYTDSGYSVALDLANGGTKAKAKVVIGCDPIVRRYIERRGDPRLLGEHLDYVIVDTVDSRMKGKIVLTFTTDKPGTDDGLGFGTHVYVPELIQSLTRNMNGGSSKVDRVVPRNIHVVALPVVAVIDVVNLSDALTNKQ